MQLKTKIQKVLCILLSVLMLMSVLPTTAFAYEGVTFTALDGTAGASTAGGTENCDKLVDGSLDTKWCVTNFSSAYIVIEASSAIKVSGYQMSTGDDTASETSRNPKDWTLYGCNDYNAEAKTGTWDVIHRVIGDTVLQYTNKTTYSFACDMTNVEYKYFKLEITKNSGSERCMQLSEFAFTDCAHETTTVNTVEADCTNYGYVEKSCSVCSLTYKMITEDAKSHTWTDVDRTPATCTVSGKINQICSVCDANRTVNDPDVPAKGHNWAEVDKTPATCTEGGKINQECSVCNETRSIDDPDVPPLGHEFDVDGHCTRCGASVKATVTADSATPYVDKNVSISVAGEYLFYRVTAQKDGIFTFYTKGDVDTYGYLLSSSDINTDNPIMTNDDDGEGQNCRIDYCAFEGETVYFAVRYYSSFTVDRLFNVHTDFEEAYVDSGVFYVKDTDAETGNDFYFVKGYKFNTPTDVTIPSEINGSPVTYIAKDAFNDCEYLTGVTIPGSVKEINERAFYQCTNLKTVTLGEGIDYIGCGAFSGTAIETITIPGSVKTIDSNAFCPCANLKTVILNEGLENIADWAFGDTAVESVTIPASVKDFNSSAFACCYDLKSISVSDANEVYKSDNNVVYSKDGTMLVYTLPSLTGTFVVAQGVKSIEFDAFYASLISGVKLSSTVEYIGCDAFEDCYNLSSVELNEGLKKIDEYAFENCNKLFSVKLPSTLETIAYRAFAHCAFYSIDIPASVTMIGSGAFYDSNVEAIIINNKNTELITNSIDSSVTIYGHTGSTAETYANSKLNTFVSIDLEEGVECTHSFVKDEIITAPTCASKGLIKTKCAICDAQGEDAEIETLDHNKPVGVCTECGDKEPYVSDIGVNQSITCTISDEYPIATACFTASQDGTYTATISDMNNIGNFVVASNTAKNSFYYIPNKETATFELKAGEQIFIAAVKSGPVSGASFKATVTCNHTNVNTIPTPTPTPTPTPDPTPTPTPAPAPSNEITYKGETIKPNANGEYVSKEAKRPVITNRKGYKKEFKVTWKKISGVSGYQIQYSTSKKFTKKTTKTVYSKGNKKYTKTIKKLKSKKKYYVRVRTYKKVNINGKTVKIYSKWSKVKTVTTK